MALFLNKNNLFFHFSHFSFLMRFLQKIKKYLNFKNLIFYYLNYFEKNFLLKKTEKTF